MRQSKRFLPLAVAVLLLGVGIGSAMNDQPSNVTPSVSTATTQSKQTFVESEDNAIDIATINGYDRDVSILINQGDGSFGNRQDYAVDNSSGADDIVSADFNQDGYDDYAVTNYNDKKIHIFHANGQGGFTWVQDKKTFGCDVYDLQTADFNNDSYPDMVFIGFYHRYFDILLNKGDGTFYQRKRHVIDGEPARSQGFPYKTAVGDFNNDGNADLAFTFEKWRWGPMITTCEHYFSVHLGKGDGRFEPYTLIPTGLGYYPDITTADFNKDGNLDIALTNNFERNVGLYLGDGTGNFSNPSTFPIIFDPWQIRSADFNNDGNSDLLVSTFDTRYFEILLGDGTGNFVDHTRFQGVGRDILVDDLNNDGNVDIATLTDDGYPSNGQLNILLGKGNAEFEDPAFYQVGAIPAAIITGEFGNTRSYVQAINKPTVRSDEQVSSPFSDSIQKAGSTFFSWDENMVEAEHRYYPTPQIEKIQRDPAPQSRDLSSQKNECITTTGTIYNFETNPVDSFRPTGNADNQTNQQMDLIVSNLWGDDLSSIQGDGIGGFQNRKDNPIAGWPSKITYGDFNSDANTDLAVVNAFDQTISISLGTGTGEFIPHQVVDVGFVASRYHCGEIVTQDLNNDGLLDLAVANYMDADVTLLFGDGTGSFSNRTDLPAGNLAMGLVSEDFNCDGFYDLAVTNLHDADREFVVYINNGTTPGFNRTEYNFSSWRDVYFRDIIAADFNSDSFVDLAMLDHGSEQVFVFCGDGSGRYDSYPIRSSAIGDWKEGVKQMTAADFNNDGILDVAVSAEGYYGGVDVVNILFGDGTGKFPRDTKVSIDVDSPRVNDIVAADFNSDGAMDIVVADNEFNGGCGLFYGDGTGNFSNKTYMGTGNKPFGVISFDANTDGAADLVVANSRDNDISIILNDGSGEFINEKRYQEFDKQFTCVGLRDIAQGDFNNDRFIDLAVATDSPNMLTILFGNGQGSYSHSIQYEFCCGQVPTDLLVYDFDGDGALDIAAADFYHDVMYLFWNNGSGGFRLDSKRLSLGRYPQESVLGDFNADGEQDIAVANWGGADISVLFSDGTGWFSSQKKFATPERPVGIVSGDFNLDGYLDLAVASYSTDTVSVLYGDGTGEFPKRSDYRVGWYPMSLTTEDVNSDDCLDLIVPIRGRQNRGITILYGDTNGDFTYSLSYTVSQELCSIKTADFNQDGYVDLAGTDRDDHNIHILYGDGTGAFPLHSVQPGGWHPWNLLIGEYTGTLPTQPTISGPTNPEAGSTQSYQISSQDNEQDPLFYQIDWGDGTRTSWLGPFPSGQQITVYHRWDITKNAIIRVTTKDTHDIISLPGAYAVSIESRIPSTPVITCPEQVASEEQTSVTVTATDPDEDQLYYLINWDDGTTKEWIGPYPSGEPVTVAHTWSEPKTYRISVQAKDHYETTSEKSYHTLEVTNSEPQNLNIEAPSFGKARYEITSTLTATDPEDHDIFFFIDWGDGNTTGWLGPSTSTQPYSIIHRYARLGRYKIQICSKDIWDAQSSWGTHPITILPSLSNTDSHSFSTNQRCSSNNYDAIK